MKNEKLIIRGARTHNLKNINLELPKNKLIVITGVSGSGKSSLAFDTLYAEGQRRYVESLSAYARQFLEQMEKPDVDSIEGLMPSISIEQKATSHNPRSTVGTVTEIYDYLRLLFARIGTPYCPTHNKELQNQSISEIVDTILAMPNNTKIAILAPLAISKKGEYLDLFDSIQSLGFTKVKIDSNIYDIDNIPKLNKHVKHDIDIVIDRLIVKHDHKNRITDSIETAIKHGNGKIKIINLESNNEQLISLNYSCPNCDYSIGDLEPRMFSFNNPIGACNLCDGIGEVTFFDPKKIINNHELSIANGAIKGWDQRNSYTYQHLVSLAKHYKFDLNIPWKDLKDDIKDILLYGTKDTKIKMKILLETGRSINKNAPFEGILNTLKRRYFETDSNYIKEELLKYQNNKLCPECNGSRLKLQSRFIKINSETISNISSWQLQECYNFFKKIKLHGNSKVIGEKIIKEIMLRLGFLIDVGLNYITLNRSSETLSGGESQRIRLASQIGSGLTGVMYVLDEPSIGLHQKDNAKLLSTLSKLKDLGNTVIVVEHDKDAILAADYVIDIGPGAGIHGGKVIAQGSVKDILNNSNSITGQYLSGKRKISIPEIRRKQNNGYLEVVGAKGNNLKNVHLKIPIGNFVCITGVSGSGKSTLINDTLYKIAMQYINGSNINSCKYEKIIGIEMFDKVIGIDQSPIGRTPRSNPATYTKLFDHVREIFAKTQIAKERGYEVGRFSFNVKDGRCRTCEGDGVIKVAMHFLPDIYVICETCQGKRYNRETLEVSYRGKNISDILEMTVEEAHNFFINHSILGKKLATLIDVGLGYIKLGQNATTLSGGEAQRIKLALELSKKDTGKTLYILDEPTTGLHFQDIELLLKILHKFVNSGNTVVIIEHNLDVIKTADWIIDLGVDGGDNGGKIIAKGTPESIVKNNIGYTAKFLKSYLDV